MIWPPYTGRQLFLSFAPSCIHWGHLCLSPHGLKFSSSADSVMKTFYFVLFILWDLHHLCMDAERVDLLSFPVAQGMTHWPTLFPDCTHLNSPKAEISTSCYFPATVTTIFYSDEMLIKCRKLNMNRIYHILPQNAKQGSVPRHYQAFLEEPM